MRLLLAHVQAGDEKELGTVDDFQILHHVPQPLIFLLDAQQPAAEAVRKEKVVMKQMLVDRLGNHHHAAAVEQVAELLGVLLRRNHHHARARGIGKMLRQRHAVFVNQRRVNHNQVVGGFLTALSRAVSGIHRGDARITLLPQQLRQCLGTLF